MRVSSIFVCNVIENYTRYSLTHNDQDQPLPEAGARQEQTLEAVGCILLLGDVAVHGGRKKRRMPLFIPLKKR